MTKITNTAEGPRGVESIDGTVYIDPGQTVDVLLKDDSAPLYEGLERASSKKAASDKAE